MKTKSVVLKEFEQLLRMAYHGRTVQNYLFHVSKFLDFANSAPSRVTNDDFLDFNRNLAISDYSYSYRNVAINAVKAYFKLYLNKKAKGFAFIRPPRQQMIPKDIPHELLTKRLNSVKNTKAKAILSLGYGCGLRSAEVINLRIIDVNIEQLSFAVTGKGNKERQIPLSPELTLLLMAYVEEYNPQYYLFNGQDRPRYSASSILKLVKIYIGPYTFHQLRHSYATRLLRNGVGIDMVSKLLGHSKQETTMIYNHLLTTELDRSLLPA